MLYAVELRDNFNVFQIFAFYLYTCLYRVGPRPHNMATRFCAHFTNATPRYECLHCL